MKGDKQRAGNSIDKGAKSHAFALGETARSSRWLECRVGGTLCLSFLYSLYYELPKGRLYGANTFPEHI